MNHQLNVLYDVGKISRINSIAGPMRLVRRADNPNKETLTHTHTHTIYPISPLTEYVQPELRIYRYVSGVIML